MADEQYPGISNGKRPALTREDDTTMNEHEATKMRFLSCAAAPIQPNGGEKFHYKCDVCGIRVTFHSHLMTVKPFCRGNEIHCNDWPTEEQS
jgi:hypothetical protein